MKRFVCISVLFALVLAGCSTPKVRVASTGGVSPHETTSVVVDGSRVTITYGRPYSKSPRNGEMRKIWGELIPWGAAWRMGADEATVLLTQQPLQFGATTIPAGAYTLYAIPMENSVSKLAFSTRVGQYGDPVDETHDLARVDLKKESLTLSTNQFTMAIEKNPAGGGTLRMKWESTQFSVPFTVKK